MLGIIMAGGQGSRLRPITDVRPKPMVEVLGRPVIDFVKDSMIQGGVSNLIVTTGYRGEMLAQHVEDWNQDGRTARINQEATPMGTAGSVRLLLDEISETVIIGSGDSVASFDVAALLKHTSVVVRKQRWHCGKLKIQVRLESLACPPRTMVTSMVNCEKDTFESSRKNQPLKKRLATSLMLVCTSLNQK